MDKKVTLKIHDEIRNSGNLDKENEINDKSTYER